jgi:hypothetical protein
MIPDSNIANRNGSPLSVEDQINFEKNTMAYTMSLIPQPKEFVFDKDEYYNITKKTAAETKAAKTAEEAETRLDIIDTLLEVEDAIPVLPDVFPTSWFNSNEGEVAKQSIIDIVERSGGNIIGDVIDDGSRGFKIKVDYDGRKRTLSTNDFRNKNILKSRLKDAVGAGVENVYDNINLE